MFCQDLGNRPDKPPVGLQGDSISDFTAPVHVLNGMTFLGFSIAQLCLIFHPHWFVHTATPLYLVYVHRFNIVPQLRTTGGSGAFPDPISGMYILKHGLRSDQSPMGDVVALSHCCIPVHLIPRFGDKADSRLTAQNSSLYSTTFSLNHYIDKDSFQYFRDSCTQLR
jgi:hypothetical protein